MRLRMCIGRGHRPRWRRSWAGWPDRAASMKLARPQHGVAIARQRGLEVRRPIRLDAVHGLRLGERRVDGAAGLRARPVQLVELLPADGQDVIRVQAVEGAQRDERVEGARGRARSRIGTVEGGLDPGRVVEDGVTRGARRGLQAHEPGAPGRPALPSGRDDLVDQRGQVRRGADFQLVPEAHRVAAQAVTGLAQGSGHALQALGHRVESLVERREVARQQQEEGVPDLVAGRGPTLPAADDLVVEVPQPRAVERHVALEARTIGEVRRVDRSRGR